MSESDLNATFAKTPVNLRAAIAEDVVNVADLAGAKAHFTPSEWRLLKAVSQFSISMDRKGAWRDNAFVERLKRTTKY
jgi:hypothetical protein